MKAEMEGRFMSAEERWVAFKRLSPFTLFRNSVTAILDPEFHLGFVFMHH